MLAIILIVVFSGAVWAYNYFWTSNPIKDVLRNTMLALSLGIMLALPIGEWQTEYIEDTNLLPVEWYMYHRVNTM